MAFYDNGFKAILTASINTLNTLPTPLTEGGYLITRVTPIEAETPTSVNTEAVLFGNGSANADGLSYGGTVTLRYRRLDLNVLFRGIRVAWSTELTTTATFADWLATTYSIPVTQTDFITIDIPPERDVYLKITAADDSPWVFGDIMVYLPSVRPNIGDYIDDDWYSGAFPDPPDVDINYKLTYPFDYSPYGEILVEADGTSTTERATLLWSIVFGERDQVMWTSDTMAYLYTGEAAVQEAGGRVGFDHLLIVPILNAWVHFNHTEDVAESRLRRTV